MKKLLFTILIFLFTEIAASDAQVFNDKKTETETDMSIANENTGGSSEEIGGLFRANDEFGRPDLGEGIGEASINDGLLLLMLYGVFFGYIMFFKEKRNKSDVKDNYKN